MTVVDNTKLKKQKQKKQVPHSHCQHPHMIQAGILTQTFCSCETWTTVAVRCIRRMGQEDSPLDM